MGNCQALDATALVIQHPSGKLERWYWQITVSEVMRNNPGHYVSVIIPVPVSSNEPQQTSSKEEEKMKRSSIRYTRVKLLQPTDTLVLGQAYRLVTTQEVMKVVQAKKKARMKNREQEYVHEGQKSGQEQQYSRKLDKPEINQETTERDQARPVQVKPVAVGRTKSWKPSLQSISEAGSKY